MIVEPGFVEQPLAPAVDLAITQVRLVDAGDLQDQGPIVRLWVRNLTRVDIPTPFSVIVLVDTSAQMSDRAEFGVTKVNGIAALGEIMVDVQLPVAANMMSQGPNAQPAPFTHLLAVADGHESIVEVDEENNLAGVARNELRLVDMRAPSRMAAARAGTQVRIKGEGYSNVPGQVTLTLAGLQMNATVSQWRNQQLLIQLPELPLNAAVNASLLITRRDGQQAEVVFAVTP